MTGYKELLEKLIEFLKREKQNEGTASATSPTELLHKIIGLASDMGLEDIKERALDDRKNNTTLR